MPLCQLCIGVQGLYTSPETPRTPTHVPAGILAGNARKRTMGEEVEKMTEWPHQPSYNDLIVSAASGCELCDLLLYDISLFTIREYRARHRPSLPHWKQMSADINTFLMNWQGKSNVVFTSVDSQKHVSRYGLFYWIGNTGITGALPYGSEIQLPNLRRFPQARFKQAWEWLDKCEHEHPDCQSPDVSYIPTRLIDVGDKSDHEINLRVVEVASAGPDNPLHDSRYIALSYCWGLSMPKSGMTTTYNLRQHLTGMSLSELPRTLQDAITITKELGIRYLWVDALCILQNKANDWQQEAAAMSKIYANAYCTISAAATSHCDGGILSDQDPRQRSVITFKDFSLHVGMPAHTALRDSATLSSRAWALQERELSPRILWFTKQMLIFECREMWASEERRDGDTHPYDSAGVRERSLNLFANRMPKKRNDGSKGSNTAIHKGYSLGSGIRIQSYEQSVGASMHNSIDSTPLLGGMYLVWRSIIEQYSSRDLTRATDKLPALSGLAHEFKAVVVSEYAAGLWVKDLLRGLLWRRSLGRRRSPPLIQQRSSTWLADSGIEDYVILPAIKRVNTLMSSISSLTVSTPTVISESPSSSITLKPHNSKKQYIAPSWSWASSTQTIDYRVAKNSQRIDDAGSKSLQATVLSVTTTPLGSDPMGEITDGRIRLFGAIRSLRDWLAVPRDYFISEMIRWDTDEEDDDDHSIGSNGLPLEKKNRSLKEELGRNLEGVMIVGIMRDDPVMEDVRSYNGLLIRQTDVVGEYVRVGLIKSVHAEWLGLVAKKEITLV